MSNPNLKVSSSFSDFGADPSLQDADGQTALHHACSSNSSKGPACAEMLISKDAGCCKISNRIGQIPFQLISSMNAAWSKLIKWFDLLIMHFHYHAINLIYFLKPNTIL